MVHETPKFDLGRYRETQRLKDLELARQRMIPKGKQVVKGLQINHETMAEMIKEVDDNLKRERRDYLTQHDMTAKSN